MSITSDEVNYLVYRYLQESGFCHSAFTFAYESQLSKSKVVATELPPGALVSFLQKGLFYLGIEAHINEDGTSRECTEEISLLRPHICRVKGEATKVTTNQTSSMTSKTNETTASTQPNAKNSSNSSAKNGEQRDKPTSTASDVSKSPPSDQAKAEKNKKLTSVSPTPQSGETQKKEGPEPASANPMGKPVKAENTKTGSSSVTKNSMEAVQNDKQIVVKKSPPKSSLATESKEANNTNDNTATASPVQANIGVTGKRKRKLDETSPERIDKTKKLTELNGSMNSNALSMRILSGHKKEVLSCSWNPQKNVLVSGSNDSTARIWQIPANFDDKDKVQSITSSILTHGEGSKKYVTTIEWNHNGSFLASGSYEGETRVWSSKGELVHTFHFHNGPVFAIRWNKSSSLLLSVGFDKTVCLWDSKLKVQKQKVELHDGPILDASWKNDRTFATCSSDKTIRITDVGETKAHLTLKGHTNEINTVKWDPSGKFLASCSDDFSVKIWDVSLDASKACIFDFREHKKEVNTIRWSPDVPSSPFFTLASASFDTTVKLWNVKTGKCIRTFNHDCPVYAIAYSPDGKYLASGDLNGVINVWSIENENLVKVYHGNGDIFDVNWNTEGNMISACYSNGDIAVVNFNLSTSK